MTSSVQHAPTARLYPSGAVAGVSENSLPGLTASPQSYVSQYSSSKGGDTSGETTLTSLSSTDSLGLEALSLAHNTKHDGSPLSSGVAPPHGMHQYPLQQIIPLQSSGFPYRPPQHFRDISSSSAESTSPGLINSVPDTSPASESSSLRGHSPSRGLFYNPTNTTNVYIRGLPVNTTDKALRELCEPFGTISSSKAILDPKEGYCKGYGFVMYATEEDSKRAITELHNQGYQVSFAKESFSTRLKNLGDPSSTNLYISNLPLDMNEEGLTELLQPYEILSSRILSQEGTSRGVGFARVAERDAAEGIIHKFNGIHLPNSPYPLQVRFADSVAQKKLKGQTAKRRMFRAREFGDGMQPQGMYYHPTSPQMAEAQAIQAAAVAAYNPQAVHIGHQYFGNPQLYMPSMHHHAAVTTQSSPQRGLLGVNTGQHGGTNEPSSSPTTEMPNTTAAPAYGHVSSTAPVSATFPNPQTPPSNQTQMPYYPYAAGMHMPMSPAMYGVAVLPPTSGPHGYYLPANPGFYAQPYHPMHYGPQGGRGQAGAVGLQGQIQGQGAARGGRRPSGSKGHVDGGRGGAGDR